MPLARGLHPDFGYVGSPRLCRKLSLILALMVFGLLVGARVVIVFMANPDPDPNPMKAMAFAPAKAPESATNSPMMTTAETKVVESGLARETFIAAGIKTPCRENIAEQVGRGCSTGKASKLHSLRAVNERPAIAAVLVGHDGGQPILPLEQEIPVPPIVAPKQDIRGGSVKPANTSKAATASIIKESPAPAASTKRLQTRSNGVQRRDRAAGKSIQHRNRYEYPPSWSYSYQNGWSGYAWSGRMVRRSWVW